MTQRPYNHNPYPIGVSLRSDTAFYWDAVNGVWLSTHLEVATQSVWATGLNDCYVSADDGSRYPWDMAVVAMTATWSQPATTGNIRCRRDGVNVTSLDLAVDGVTSTTASNDSLYGAFDAGGNLQFYLDTLSGAIDYPTVTAWLRRRET